VYNVQSLRRAKCFPDHNRSSNLLAVQIVCDRAKIGDNARDLHVDVKTF